VVDVGWGRVDEWSEAAGEYGGESVRENERECVLRRDFGLALKGEGEATSGVASDGSDGNGGRSGLKLSMRCFLCRVLPRALLGPIEAVRA